MSYAYMMPARTHEPNEVVVGRLRRNWFASLQQISDVDLQRRMWLDVTNRNPHWSYIEFVSKYPEADQLADARERDWLTAGEFEIMSGFGLKLSAHTAPGGDGYDNAAILDDPAWHAVIAAAQLARQELVSFVTDQSEREILLATSSR